MNKLSCFHCKRIIEETEDFSLKKESETQVVILCAACAFEEDVLNTKMAEGLFKALLPVE